MDDGNERDVSCVCLLDPLLLLLLILTYVTTGVSLVIWCRLLHHSENLHFPQTSSCPMPRIVGQRFRTELSLVLSRARLRFREVERVFSAVATYWRWFLLAFMCDVCRVSK